MPPPWKASLRDGSAPTWGEDALPAGLLDEDEVTRGAVQLWGLPYPPTLRTQREPAQVANLIVFLCQDSSLDITGAALPIDQGRSATWLEFGQ